MGLATNVFTPAMCDQCKGSIHAIGGVWACGRCGLPVKTDDGSSITATRKDGPNFVKPTVVNQNIKNDGHSVVADSKPVDADGDAGDEQHTSRRGRKKHSE